MTSRTNVDVFYRLETLVDLSTSKTSVCISYCSVSVSGVGQLMAHRLTSFYFLIDVFHSIHLKTPPSFNPRDLSFALTKIFAGTFEDLYTQIILNRKSLFPELSPDEYLLALLCILFEIVHLLRFLGLFTDESFHNTVQTVDDRGESW